MRNELSSLSRLFTETIFRIPDYQRGYAWTDKQLREFWSDIEQLEPGKNHYIGVLTVEDVPQSEYRRWDDDLWIINSKRYQPLYVVDGQQRLTTAIILIQCIIEKLGDSDVLNYTTKDEIKKKFIFESRDNGISRSYLFGYEKDNPSYQHLKRAIYVERSDSHSTAEATIYTKNLDDAKARLKEQIAKFSLSQLEILYHKLTQKLLFNSYTISDDIDVFVTFETMNNRGKRLSHLELLKNRLIWLSTKLPDSREERDKLRSTVNECWKSVYHYLGRSSECAIDDDVFLRRHYILYFGAQQIVKFPDDELMAICDDYNEEEAASLADVTVFKAAYDDFLLEEYFIVKNVIGNDDNSPKIDLHSMYEYAHSVKDLVEIQDHIANPLESSFSNEEKVILSRIFRISDNDDDVYLLLLALYHFNSKNETGNRVSVLRLIENILFVKEIYLYAREFADFAFKLTSLRLRAKKITSADLVGILEKYIEERNAKINIKREISWWARKPLGFYRWKPIKYFMFEYEQHLRMKSKNNREKLYWREFVGERKGSDFNSIEHILPQQVTHEYWKHRTKQFDVRKRNILKNSLGNLLPLSSPKNASLGNRSFPEKKGNAINQVGYAYGCYSEIEVSQEAEWNATSILERGLRLLAFLEERWNLPLGTREDKIKILELEFVSSRKKDSLV